MQSRKFLLFKTIQVRNVLDILLDYLIAYFFNNALMLLTLFIVINTN